MILVCDLDGTLSLSPPVVGNAFAEWERAISATPPPVIDGAREGVRDLLAVCRRAIILTARNERIRAATERWISDAFPALRGARVSMRAKHDLGPSSVSKLDRLRRLRWETGYEPIVLVDDDVAMRVAVGPGDKWLLAPACWAAEARSAAFGLRSQAQKNLAGGDDVTRCHTPAGEA